MTLKKRSTEIIIVGDTQLFGRAISDILKISDGSHYVRFTTYDQFRGTLTTRLMQETDLFILDLWRTYATGLRAEGLAVAEELSKQHVKTLVISPLCLGNYINIPWYWDLGSEDALSARCKKILCERGIPSGTDGGPLHEWLADYLAAPEGHDRK